VPLTGTPTEDRMAKPERTLPEWSTCRSVRMPIRPARRTRAAVSARPATEAMTIDHGTAITPRPAEPPSRRTPSVCTTITVIDATEAEPA